VDDRLKTPPPFFLFSAKAATVPSSPTSTAVDNVGGFMKKFSTLWPMRYGFATRLELLEGWDCSLHSVVTTADFSPHRKY
jgi:hypothetical protein